jgi:methylmalonyl-CoA mutase
MFADFKATDKKQWLAQIEKDLKGKPFDDIRWHLGEDFTIEPFYHQEDSTVKSIGFSMTNDWDICETIEIEKEDYKTANRLAIEALMGGANALNFVISNNTSLNEMEVLLKDIELSYIATHFFFTGKKTRLAQKKLEHFYTIATKKGENTALLRGSLHIAPLGHTPNWVHTKAMVAWINQHLPNFKAITINACSFHTEPENVADELAKTLALANDFLAELSEQGMSVEDLNKTLQFTISIDKSYFINIAKIRALKLLYLNVLKGYQLENAALPPIFASFAALSFDENANTNMIRATTMALSAANAGVQTLDVLPSDTQNSSFGRRIARNVQHLLKMESHIDKVGDPSAGSYYIEQLTEKIATKAWEKWTNKLS